MVDPVPPSVQNGALSVQVAVEPVIASQRTTISFVIRNTFTEPVEIEGIDAPAKQPLLRADNTRPASSGFWSGVRATFTAEYRAQAERLGVEFGKNEAPAAPKAVGPVVVPGGQDDVVSIDIVTNRWLFVTPRSMDVHAVLRYKVNGKSCSQVIPFQILIRPPLQSVMYGSVSGAVSGYVVRAFNVRPETFEWATTLALIPGLIGIVGMALIIGMVLSHKESAKGFVTLEDFFGAFVVGVLLGAAGPSFYESVLGALPQPDPGAVPALPSSSELVSSAPVS